MLPFFLIESCCCRLKVNVLKFKKFVLPPVECGINVWCLYAAYNETLCTAQEGMGRHVTDIGGKLELKHAGVVLKVEVGNLKCRH